MRKGRGRTTTNKFYLYHRGHVLDVICRTTDDDVFKKRLECVEGKFPDYVTLLTEFRNRLKKKDEKKGVPKRDVLNTPTHSSD